MTENKRGFLARRAQGTVRYVGRRIGNPFIAEVGIDNFKKGVVGAREAMKPQKLDREDFQSGLNGRYADGGVARFAEIMKEADLKEDDLPQMQYTRRRSAIIMFISAALFVALGSYVMISGTGGRDILMGFVTAFVSFVLVAIGVREDFSRWQIQMRRIGGFLEYLSGST